jgi:hypothetical protein
MNGNQRRAVRSSWRARDLLDFALYARALAAGAVFKVIPSRTYVSVVRSGSISGNHTKEDLKRLRDSDKALQQLPTLTEQEIKLVRQHYESIDARIQWLNVIDAVKMQSVASDASSTKGRREWVMGCCRFDLRSDAHVCLRRRFPVTVRWGPLLLGLRLVGAVQLVCYQDLKGVQIRGMKCWTNRSVSDHCYNSSSICLQTCLSCREGRPDLSRSAVEAI